MQRYLVTLSILLVLLFALTPCSRADTFWVYGWRTSDATNATPAWLSGPNCREGGGACDTTNYDVFFQTNDFPDLNIDFNGSVADFLASSGNPLDDLIYTNPMMASSQVGETDDPSYPNGGTIWYWKGFLQVAGTPADPEGFDILHDDGITFRLDGVEVSQPGPAVPGQDHIGLIYTGGPAVATFDLIYASCCDGQARLIMTPEPDAVVLVGTLLLLLLPAIRRIAA